MTTPLVSLREYLLNEIRLLKDRNQLKEPQGNFFPLNCTFCVICRGEIQTETEIVCCPACQTEFHKAHLAFWINQEKTCPICQRWIPVDLIQLGGRE